jgi:hypothetical protein
MRNSKWLAVKRRDAYGYGDDYDFLCVIGNVSSSIVATWVCVLVGVDGGRSWCCLGGAGIPKWNTAGLACEESLDVSKELGQVVLGVQRGGWMVL